MDQAAFTAVDDYLVDELVPQDAALTGALDAAAAAGLPHINVAPNQGKLLDLLVRMTGARQVLEIGTLGGYSTIWMARALPEGGRLVTLEAAAAHADVARTNLEAAGVADRVEIRVGAALESLPKLESEGAGPFDLVFIDADKANNANYLDWSLRLTRAGSVIVCDNVVAAGAVVDLQRTDDHVVGIRTFFDRISADPRLEATALQTVGSKGWDGFALAVVVG